jgi:hypothetical protein
MGVGVHDLLQHEFTAFINDCLILTASPFVLTVYLVESFIKNMQPDLTPCILQVIWISSSIFLLIFPYRIATVPCLIVAVTSAPINSPYSLLIMSTYHIPFAIVDSETDGAGQISI